MTDSLQSLGTKPRLYNPFIDPLESLDLSPGASIHRTTGPEPNFVDILSAAGAIDFLGGNMGSYIALAEARANAREAEREDLFTEEIFTRYPALQSENGQVLLSNAKTEEEAYWINLILTHERQDRELLERAGWPGIFGRLAMGILSPENWIPMGYFFKGAKTIKEFATAGAKGATIGAAIGETGLQHMQLERPYEESIFAAMAAPIVGGFIGGGIGSISAIAHSAFVHNASVMAKNYYHEATGIPMSEAIPVRAREVASQLGADARKAVRSVRDANYEDAVVRLRGAGRTAREEADKIVQRAKDGWQDAKKEVAAKQADEAHRAELEEARILDDREVVTEEQARLEEEDLRQVEAQEEARFAKHQEDLRDTVRGDAEQAARDAGAEEESVLLAEKADLETEIERLRGPTHGLRGDDWTEALTSLRQKLKEVNISLKEIAEAKQGALDAISAAEQADIRRLDQLDEEANAQGVEIDDLHRQQYVAVREETDVAEARLSEVEGDLRNAEEAQANAVGHNDESPEANALAEAVDEGVSISRADVGEASRAVGVARGKEAQTRFQLRLSQQKETLQALNRARYNADVKRAARANTVERLKQAEAAKEQGAPNADEAILRNQQRLEELDQQLTEKNAEVQALQAERRNFEEIQRQKETQEERSESLRESRIAFVRLLNQPNKHDEIEDLLHHIDMLERTSKRDALENATGQAERDAIDRTYPLHQQDMLELYRKKYPKRAYPRSYKKWEEIPTREIEADQELSRIADTILEDEKALAAHRSTWSRIVKRPKWRRDSSALRLRGLERKVREGQQALLERMREIQISRSEMGRIEQNTAPLGEISLHMANWKDRRAWRGILVSVNGRRGFIVDPYSAGYGHLEVYMLPGVDVKRPVDLKASARWAPGYTRETTGEGIQLINASQIRLLLTGDDMMQRVSHKALLDRELVGNPSIVFNRDVRPQDLGGAVIPVSPGRAEQLARLAGTKNAKKRKTLVNQLRQELDDSWRVQYEQPPTGATERVETGRTGRATKWSRLKVQRAANRLDELAGDDTTLRNRVEALTPLPKRDQDPSLWKSQWDARARARNKSENRPDLAEAADELADAREQLAADTFRALREEQVIPANVIEAAEMGHRSTEARQGGGLRRPGSKEVEGPGRISGQLVEEKAGPLKGRPETDPMAEQAWGQRERLRELTRDVRKRLSDLRNLSGFEIADPKLRAEFVNDMAKRFPKYKEMLSGEHALEALDREIIRTERILAQIEASQKNTAPTIVSGLGAVDRQTGALDREWQIWENRVNAWIINGYMNGHIEPRKPIEASGQPRTFVERPDGELVQADVSIRGEPQKESQLAGRALGETQESVADLVEMAPRIPGTRTGDEIVSLFYRNINELTPEERIQLDDAKIAGYETLESRMHPDDPDPDLPGGAGREEDIEGIQFHGEDIDEDFLSAYPMDREVYDRLGSGEFGQPGDALGIHIEGEAPPNASDLTPAKGVRLIDYLLDPDHFHAVARPQQAMVTGAGRKDPIGLKDEEGGWIIRPKMMETLSNLDAETKQKINSLEDLQEHVSGIGPKTIQKLADWERAMLGHRTNEAGSSVPRTSEEMLAGKPTVTLARRGERTQSQRPPRRPGHGYEPYDVIGPNQAYGYHMEKMLGLDPQQLQRVLRHNPKLRLLLSDFDESRTIAQHLVDYGSIWMKEYKEGKPKFKNAENETFIQWRNKEIRILKQLPVLYTKAAQRIHGKNQDIAPGLMNTRKVATQEWLRKKVGRDHLTVGDFYTRVTRALRGDDTDPDIPEVTEAARLIRKELFEPAKEAMLELKMLPNNPDALEHFAKGYVTRIWNVEQVAARRDQWIELVEDLLVEEQRLTRQDAAATARAMHEAILSGPEGRLDPELFNLRKTRPAQSRTVPGKDLMWMDNEFLVDDIDVILKYYFRTVPADIELSRLDKMFAPTSHTRRKNWKPDPGLKRLLDDSAAKMERKALSHPEGSPERAKLLRQLESDMRDLHGIVEIMRGTYAIPKDPHGKIRRGALALRRHNYITDGGTFMLSSIPDIVRPWMVMGMSRFYGTGIRTLIKEWDSVKLNAREGELAGAGADWWTNRRTLELFDLGGGYGRGNRFERIQQRATDEMSVLNGLSAWNTNLKRWSGVMIAQRIVDYSQVIATGHRWDGVVATKAEIDEAKLELARGGIGSQDFVDSPHGNDAIRIWEQVKNRPVEDRLRVLETELWNDDGARDVFRGALRSGIDSTINTPGIGDRPLFMSRDMGRLILQYKSFAFASTMQTAIPGLQAPNAAFLTGAAMSTSFAMLSLYIKARLLGWAVPDIDTEDGLLWWIRNGVSRAGFTGITDDLNTWMGFATNGQLTVGNLLTGSVDPEFKYSGRGLVGQTFGPSVGTLTDVATMGGAVANMMFNQEQPPLRAWNAMKRNIPGQNLPPFKALLDPAMRSANRAFRREFVDELKPGSQGVPGLEGMPSWLDEPGMDIR